MPPISLGTSHSKLALETGQAKLWILLIGVNEYEDGNLPRLSYPAFDCQGLSESLIEATLAFPQKDITIYYDFGEQKPILETVKASLENIVTSAKTQDTILFYFSGHGLLDTQSQQTVLCLANTKTDNLLNTGLTLQWLLRRLGQCLAHCQVIWLDACHCGNMTLTGAKSGITEPLWDDPTVQLLETLRQSAAKSKGFYALLSCDQGQKSWEFPDLGHGVFSYFLMRGLRGEAADFKGLIKADDLYQYVYSQTLNYIDKVNQQLRLINQQKRHRGEPHLYSEYSLQTPKRIVEGVGELILGLKSPSPSPKDHRYALLFEGLPENQTMMALGEVLQQEGHFSVTFLSPMGKQELEVQEQIQSFCQPRTLLGQNIPTLSPSDTLLLYLRGRIEVEAKGESYWVLENGIRLSRSWLRQELRRCHLAQQIVILDGYGTGLIEPWIEELKLGSDHGQCLLGALNPDGEPDLFAQVLLESLVAANPSTGLSAAQWLSLLQTNCEQLCLTFSAWLSGTQGVIDILPGKNEENLPVSPKVKQKTATPIISSPSPLPNYASETLQGEQTPAIPSQTPLPNHASVSPSLFPEQYANLSQFLNELVGPVALPLLQSALEETNSTETLLENLAQYLSSEQKIKLDKWAIAPTLLTEMAEQFQEPELLIGGLKNYLTPVERSEFEKQLVSVFTKNETEKMPVLPCDVQEVEPTPRSLDETFIHQCQQELTRIIGPIAQFIIQTTLEDRPQISRTEFIEVIAAAISNTEESANFRQRWII